MKNNRPMEARTKDQVSNRVHLDVLPPVQAGLSAALRRAFKAPADENARQFDELLKQLA